MSIDQGIDQITYYVGHPEFSQTLVASDTTSVAHGSLLCGLINFEITPDNDTPLQLIGETLKVQTNDEAHITTGPSHLTYTVTATLQDYPSIKTTGALTVEIKADPCLLAVLSFEPVL